MENFSLFVKVNLAEVIMAIVGLAGSIIILYLLKKNPKALGIKTKPAPKMYLLALVPLALLALIFFQDKNEGLSYPTGISIHQNTLVVDGVIETIRHNPTNDDITYVEKHSRTFLFDKTTGKEITNLSGFTPMYCAGTMMLGSANFGYHIVDLATGKVLNVMSEDDIKARAAALAGEKIYSIELRKGETSFTIRTLKDKNFIYDPILEKTVSPETHTPFYTGYSNEKFTSKKVDLFLAEELGKTKDGTTLVLSYDDLEKKSFLISAISPGSELVWTKRDSEISPKLQGEDFTIEATSRNVVMDAEYFYFVNNSHLVCASLANGELKWMIPI
jgi:hypothetical protein